MPAAPPSPLTALQQDRVRAVVLLGPADGTAPDATDEVDFLYPTRIDRRAGSKGDAASFVYDLGRTGEYVVDAELRDEMTRQIEVRLADDEGNPIGGALFAGEMTQQTLQVGPDA